MFGLNLFQAIAYPLLGIGYAVAIVVIIRNTYRNPVEDDPDELPDGDWPNVPIAGRVGRVSSFDHASEIDQ